LERAEGSVQGDPRLDRLLEALAALGSHSPDRAEQVQLIFSREYDEGWQDALKVKAR
jgi:hypothetical protein